MFIVTTKLHRKRAVLGVVAIVLCCAAFAAAQLNGNPDAISSSATGVSTKGIRTNEDRISYLGSYGWEVAEEPNATEELQLPEEFDETYTAYLDIQSQQGFDLTTYCGKRVKRYTYQITNYPTGETGVLVNLLIYKNTVIGGEVLSTQLDGFMHGLAMPQ